MNLCAYAYTHLRNVLFFRIILAKAIFFVLCVTSMYDNTQEAKSRDQVKLYAKTNQIV